MFRGRKRKMPYFMAPKPYIPGPDLDQPNQEPGQNQIHQELLVRVHHQDEHHVRQVQEQHHRHIEHVNQDNGPQQEPQGVEDIGGANNHPQWQHEDGANHEVPGAFGVAEPRHREPEQVHPHELMNMEEVQQQQPQVIDDLSEAEEQFNENVDDGSHFDLDDDGLLMGHQEEEAGTEEEAHPEEEEHQEVFYESESESELEDSEDDEDFFFNYVEDTDTYEAVLEKFAKDWLNIELDHTVSKTASNLFWQLSTKHLARVLEVKTREKVKKNIPQMKHIREKLYQKNVPKVHMKIAYRHKETQEVTVVNSSVTPKSRFPSNEYEKLYEIASVKVRVGCTFEAVKSKFWVR